MSVPAITGLEQIIYLDLTNILSVLGGLFFWFTFITFSLVSRRYSNLFKEKTNWQFLALAPTGFLIYTIIQAYGYGARGSITEMEQLVCYSLLMISGLSTVIGAEKFALLNEKLRRGQSKKHQLKISNLFVFGSAFIMLLMLILGIWMGMPFRAVLCDIGFALMAIALLRYSLMVKEWVIKMKKPLMTWQLLFIGVISIIVFIIPHMIAYSQHVPYLQSNPDAYYGLWTCRTISFSALAIGGILSFIGGWLFFEMKLLKKY